MFGIPSARLSVFNFTRGKTAHVGPYVLGVCRLPDDPVGTAAVTFSGVVAGSEIHVYLPDGTEVAGVESCDANHTLSWPVYPIGSPNNTVSVTIIKRGLRWQKFPYTSVVGNTVIPLFPLPDLGYNNPD